MKTKKNLFIFIIIAFTIFIFSCSNNNDPVYTVWTDISTASQFKTSVGTELYDGKYITVEFTNGQFKQMETVLTNENDCKHNWTESELKKYFIGRGFDNDIATQTAAWLVTVNHGLVASRSGNIVYILIK